MERRSVEVAFAGMAATRGLVVALAAVALLLTASPAAAANSTVTVCGHHNDDCHGVSSAALGLTVSVFVFPPVLLLCGLACYAAADENDIDTSNLRLPTRRASARASAPTTATASAAAPAPQVVVGGSGSAIELAAVYRNDGAIQHSGSMRQRRTSRGHVLSSPPKKSPQRRNSFTESDAKVGESNDPGSSTVSLDVNGPPPGKWRCPQCDFDNDNALRNCELCAANKP